MRTGDIVSLTVMLPNDETRGTCSGVWWSRGQDFAVENTFMEAHTQARLQNYVKRLVKEPADSIPGAPTGPKRESYALINQAAMGSKCVRWALRAQNGDPGYTAG